MIYFKSALSGFLAVLVSTLLLGLGFFVWLNLPFRPLLDSGTGSAGIGAVYFTVNSLALLVFAIITFAVGFVWRYRRLSKRA
jgi:hypothetical protein